MERSSSSPLPRLIILIALCWLPAAVLAGGWADFAKQIFQQSGVAEQGAALAEEEIVQGLREALAKGTKSAILQLGSADGFWANEQFRIPLPKTVVQADSFMRAAGYGPQIDEMHLSFNRAAEKAVPVAADVFSEAVQKLTINDARAILSGPPDAATQYFKQATSETLTTQFKPLVANVTASSGLVQQYEKMMAAAGPLALLAGADADVNAYVTSKALEGLFQRVAQEERAIRTNPAARTSEVMKKVFAN